MEYREEIRRLFERQCALYPRLEAQDLVKALYQSEFGCGHLVSGDGLQRLEEEERTFARAAREKEPPFLEPLGQAFCRAHLSGLAASGLKISTLFHLFQLSAQALAGEAARFREGLKFLEALAAEGELGLDFEKTRRFLAEYISAGCPATHHSAAFRRAYSPAYRVIRAEFARFVPLFSRLDRLLEEKETVLVAIEGASASGKTSLSALLNHVYECNVFHMDDFFLQSHQRTARRLAEPGGNVDRERFLAEVLLPLQRGGEFAYRIFDCSKMAITETVRVKPRRLNVVEGAYSMHPALCGAYDLSVFLEIDPATQAARILKRNGPQAQERFLREWIPLENLYFAQTNARGRCAMILEGRELTEQ